ncbi:MAG: hypothetical protein F6K42_20555 [Leptolyngbya sp. SIO1D8]|nr:hypothetical protein [Leptolyngbya sp. SIO1D8]
MTGKKDRTQLQALFKTGAKPSEEDFRNFIDSVLNISEDGIEKPPGVETPLKILAQGEAENLLDFYVGDRPTWRLNQKPTGTNPGLNFETGSISKLFIESNTGNVGLSTTQPKAKLHIQPTEGQATLRIDDGTTNTPALTIDAEGKVGVGKALSTKQLTVNGEVTASGPLSVTESSTLTGSVGIGIAANSAHKLTVFDGEFALKVANNENPQGILFQNSGGAYTWRIYRENVSNNNADLKIAGGLQADYTALADHIRIQNNGNTTFSGSLTLSGNQKIAFQDVNTSNHLKLQLWSGYGLGINGSTLFYAANGKHSWRDANGTNERMALNTASNGGLTVKGTGASSFAGDLSVKGVSAYFPGHIFLRRYSTQNIAYLQARDDSDKQNISLRIRTQKGDGQSRTITEAMTITHDGKVGIGATNPSEKLTVNGGDIRIEGGDYRRLKIVSDSYWAGIELVARQKGRAGHPHIDFTHGELDNPNYGVRLYSPNNEALLIDGGTLGFSQNEYRPFQMRRYTGGDNPRINTGYSANDWVVIIAGFSVDGKDDSRAQYTFTYINNNQWWIAADVVGTSDTNWRINILAIRRNWVYLISRI